MAFEQQNAFLLGIEIGLAGDRTDHAELFCRDHVAEAFGHWIAVLTRLGDLTDIFLLDEIEFLLI